MFIKINHNFYDRWKYEKWEEGEGGGREKWKEESNRTTYLDGQKQIDFLVTHVYRCGIQNVVGKYFMRVYY